MDISLTSVLCLVLLLVTGTSNAQRKFQMRRFCFFLMCKAARWMAQFAIATVQSIYFTKMLVNSSLFLFTYININIQRSICIYNCIFKLLIIFLFLLTYGQQENMIVPCFNRLSVCAPEPGTEAGVPTDLPGTTTETFSSGSIVMKDKGVINCYGFIRVRNTKLD